MSSMYRSLLAEGDGEDAPTRVEVRREEDRAAVTLTDPERLNALSAVTGLAQWRVIVEAIDCFLHDLPPTDRELVDGLSERLLRAG